jgi:hypothetical protein
MKSVTFTHAGWLLACPVYIAEPESPEPFLEPRRFIPDWWMAANEFAFGVFVCAATALVPTYEPMFPILVTGALARPLTLDAPTDQVHKETT